MEHKTIQATDSNHKRKAKDKDPSSGQSLPNECPGPTADRAKPKTNHLETIPARVSPFLLLNSIHLVFESSHLCSEPIFTICSKYSQIDLYSFWSSLLVTKTVSARRSFLKIGNEEKWFEKIYFFKRQNQERLLAIYLRLLEVPELVKGLIFCKKNPKTRAEFTTNLAKNEQRLLPSATKGKTQTKIKFFGYKFICFSIKLNWFSLLFQINFSCNLTLWILFFIAFSISVNKSTEAILPSFLWWTHFLWGQH